ncbi:ribbon-helix-helix domain-containing protein [Synechococcus sp. W4D4]|uniref:ribbon-helix-helix domain-containing protein n=1 Tax=Synechococcus sp. W4D4 TaxID=3392294 RepID=UPI0039EC2BE1
MECVPTSNAPGPPGAQLRSSKRISITLNYETFKALEEISAVEGRSLSNLASYLLERSLVDAAERQLSSAAPH